MESPLNSFPSLKICLATKVPLVSLEVSKARVSKRDGDGQKIAMRTLLRKVGLLSILGIVALTLSIPSFAGSQTGYTGTISAGGIDFTATLIMNSLNHTYTLDFTGMNTNLTSSTLNAFALQLFCCGSGATFDLTNSSLPLNWTDEAGAKINDSGGLGVTPATVREAGCVAPRRTTPAFSCWRRAGSST